jgi:CTP synthase
VRFHAEALDQKVVEHLNIWTRAPRLEEWESFIKGVKSLEHEVTIGVVGKYVDLRESYKSLNEALFAGGVSNKSLVKLKFIDSEEIEALKRGVFDEVDGILVPGGFGSRGIEGKIMAAGYAREKKIPYFGICLGMQMAVAEFARNVCGLERANSTEFDPDTPHPVIHMMLDQRSITDKGGTMRLGSYDCVIGTGTKLYDIYGAGFISERHRHRFEFNNDYLAALEEKGLTASGKSPDGKLVEMVELNDHPWFIGCQFHPEFKSRPMRPHPLFVSYIKACVEYSLEKGEARTKELQETSESVSQRKEIAGL